MPNQHTATTAIPHGTNAGYQAHYRRQIPIDDLDSCGCRQAHSQYVESRRDGSVRQVSQNKERELVRSRAYRRLAKTFPREFSIILVGETRRREAELRKLERPVDD